MATNTATHRVDLFEQWRPDFPPPLPGEDFAARAIKWLVTGISYNTSADCILDISPLEQSHWISIADRTAAACAIMCRFRKQNPTHFEVDRALVFRLRAIYILTCCDAIQFSQTYPDGRKKEWYKGDAKEWKTFTTNADKWIDKTIVEDEMFDKALNELKTHPLSTSDLSHPGTMVGMTQAQQNACLFLGTLEVSARTQILKAEIKGVSFDLGEDMSSIESI